MLDRVRERIHPQEFIEARAEIEAKPLPTKLRVGVRTPRQPLALGVPARSVAVMAELRAADRMLGMGRPAAPTQRRPFSTDLIERVAAVSTAMHVDYTRHLDTMAVLDNIAALAAGLDPHTVTMALAPIAEQLDGAL